MPFRCVWLAVLGLFLVARGSPGWSAEPKKLISVEDLYRLDRPGPLVLSPDGKWAVYTRQWIDAARKSERFSLWRTDGAPPAQPLEKGEPDGRAPVLSPDGKWVAFVSTRPRPKAFSQTPPVPAASDPAADIWIIASDGGQAIPLAGPDKAYGRVFHDGFYGRLAFSPDGRRLAFIADDGKDPRTPEEIAANVEIVRDDQGEGYTGYNPAQVWLAYLDEKPGKTAASKIERLTNDDVWYGDPQWLPDGKSLVVHANKTDDRESVRYSINKNFDLWAIDVASRKQRQLTTGPGPEVSPRVSADGKRLVCLSIPRKGTHRDAFNLLVVTLGEGGPRSDVIFDHHGADGDRAPSPPPAFPLPDDCWDGSEHVLSNGLTGTETAVIRVELASARGQVLQGPGKNGSPPDTPLLQRREQRRRLEPPDNPFLQERQLGEVRVVRWDNGEGRQIEGVLILPPTGKPPYPLLLNPHGGPHGRSTTAFHFQAQVFAANGYAVFQPNFRGSEGYGQKFIDADRNDFGGGDVRDILTGIDSLVKQGLVDRERQFVFGSSYGGFLTCWLVGHTNRFKAAAAQNAVTDLNVFWGNGDLRSWVEWEFGGRPWEVPAAMRKHSPFTYVANVQTPTLILHSRDDRRCPLPMGRMFYQGLRSRGVPTQMVIYADEGHGIRQPRHQEDVLRRLLAWFAAHNK
jgi:dipeptidyl aminopeptidase/acylaminoacyl peptidase